MYGLYLAGISVLKLHLWRKMIAAANQFQTPHCNKMLKS